MTGTTKRWSSRTKNWSTPGSESTVIFAALVTLRTPSRVLSPDLDAERGATTVEVGETPIIVPVVPGPSPRSANMRSNRRRDTMPELAVRRALHAAGYRFRVDRPVRVPGWPRVIRPDLVWTGRRLAVFIDGCFWHGCSEHGQRNAAAGTYWHEKIARNRQRDAGQAAALSAAGWVVLRFWEHQDASSVAAQIAEEIDSQR